MGISSGIGAVGFVPVGVVVPFAGSTSPAGWQLCYGQAISRTTYAGLFATISTTYGSGDGSTTFNVPDLRGRVVAGEDDMGGTAASRLTAAGSGITGTTLGATGGTQTHTLTEAQIPSVASATHRHDFRFALNDNYFGANGGNAAMNYSGAYRYSTSAYQGASSDGTFGDTTRDSSSASAKTSTRFKTIGDTETPSATAGGGGAHQNTQPTIVLNYIIKAA